MRTYYGQDNAIEQKLGCDLSLNIILQHKVQVKSLISTEWYECVHTNFVCGNSAIHFFHIRAFPTFYVSTIPPFPSARDATCACEPTSHFRLIHSHYVFHQHSLTQACSQERKHTEVCVNVREAHCARKRAHLWIGGRGAHGTQAHIGLSFGGPFFDEDRQFVVFFCLKSCQKNIVAW